MAVTMEMLPRYRIAYYRQVGPYGAANKHVMKKVKRWAEKNGLLESAMIFGIPQDNPETTLPENCRYDACIVIPEATQLDDAMREGEVTGGKYVIHKVKHTAKAIHQAWTEIFSTIKESDYEIVDKPILERYTAAMLHERYCEICVPITARTSNIE